jgi:hypothetical protein
MYSKPAVLLYIRNLGTYRAMTTPLAVLVLLDWGYASPGCGAPGQLEMEGELSPTGAAMCKTYSIGAIVSVAADT